MCHTFWSICTTSKKASTIQSDPELSVPNLQNTDMELPDQPTTPTEFIKPVDLIPPTSQTQQIHYIEPHTPTPQLTLNRPTQYTHTHAHPIQSYTCHHQSLIWNGATQSTTNMRKLHGTHHQHHDSQAWVAPQEAHAASVPQGGVFQVSMASLLVYRKVSESS